MKKDDLIRIINAFEDYVVIDRCLEKMTGRPALSYSGNYKGLDSLLDILYEYSHIPKMGTIDIKDKMEWIIKVVSDDSVTAYEKYDLMQLKETPCSVREVV